jgi:hypothetical protein
MTQSQSTEMVASEVPFGRLSERENRRAVDLIESAERSAPFCLCGRHMVATAHDGHVWLECNRLQGPTSGLSGSVHRFETFFGHSRSHIMELPTNE